MFTTATTAVKKVIQYLLSTFFTEVTKTPEAIIIFHPIYAVNKKMKLVL